MPIGISQFLTVATVLCFLSADAACSEDLASNQPDAVFSYGVSSDRPANDWNEGMLTGNGTMGVIMQGDPQNDSIVINHCELYLPLGSRQIVPRLAKHIPAMKAAGMAAGLKGPSVVNGMMRNISGHKLVHTDPFHPACFLNLKMTGESSAVSNYRLTEDFPTGQLAVQWTDSRGDWQRKLFASRADNVVVISISGPKGEVGFDLGLDISHADVQKEIKADGQWLTAHCVYSKGKGGYDVAVKVVPVDGTLEQTGETLALREADHVLILLKVDRWRTPLPREISEAWANSPDNPRFTEPYKTDLREELKADIASAAEDYNTLLARHSAIHGELFSRVKLNLEGGADRKIPSSQLLEKAATENVMSPALMERMYDACRYLIICSSGEKIPNLQGIWTGTWSPAWSGDWTLDSNIQLEINSMMTCNMPEFIESYCRLVESWLPDCRKNARELYGCRGIMTNSRASDTCLQLHWSPWPGQLYISGAGWLSHFFYDYYLFTGDRDFLRERAVPILMETALFYEDYFKGQKEEDGTYRFVFSYSPENGLRGPNSTFDIAVAREVLTNLIAACTTLEIEEENLPKWKAMLAKLPKYRLDADGMLKEWSWEGAAEFFNHRHHSHLYPLYQSHELDPEETPQLWKGAKLALAKKTEHWLNGNAPNSRNITHGMMEQGLSAARLGDGELVYQVLSRMTTRRYLYSNFMIAYWPGPRGFGFDAVGSIPEVLNNSLIFSRKGTLSLLPALPKAWPKGSIEGLRARGQLAIDRLAWDMSTAAIDLQITSAIDQAITLRLPSEIKSAQNVTAGKKLTRSEEKPQCLLLDLTAGETTGLRIEL